MDLAVGFGEEGSEKGGLLGCRRWGRAFDRLMGAGELLRLWDGFRNWFGHFGARFDERSGAKVGISRRCLGGGTDRCKASWLELRACRFLGGAGMRTGFMWLVPFSLQVSYDIFVRTLSE